MEQRRDRKRIVGSRNGKLKINKETGTRSMTLPTKKKKLYGAMERCNIAPVTHGNEHNDLGLSVST